MKLRVKLSAVIIAIVVGVMVMSSVVTLMRSSSLQTASAYDHALQIANTHAIDIQRRMESYLRTAKVLAQVFGEYETFPVDQRRHDFDNIIYNIMVCNVNFTGVWTAWLPNALDGLDAEKGQYKTSYTRRNGPIEEMPNGFEGWQDYLASTKEPIITTPVWRTFSDKGEVPVVTFIYPIKSMETGRMVGIIGINYMTIIQSVADEIGNSLYNGAGVAGVYANDGTTVAHFDKERVKGNIKDNAKEKALLGDNLSTVANVIKAGGVEGEPLVLTRYSQTLGTDMHIIYHPISVEEVSTPWCLMVGIPMSAVNAPVRAMTIFTIIFTLVVIVISGVISFFVANSIAKPIVKVSLTLKDISEGEGDLTKQIEAKGKDEIGDLARYFNLTLEKIRNLVTTIKQQSTVLFDIGTELATNMNESAAAVNEITANIQNVKGRVISQSASVTQTNATMEQITSNINKLNGQVEKQTSSVTQSSSAIEEMLANIQSVTNTLVKNADNVKDLMEAAEAGRSGLQEVATDIQEVAKESAGILEINTVLEDIAAQTNLLSMNAAIEAAHAGDAGRGFAVVADEIRKLAESSSVQSKTISGVLKKIKSSIDKISSSTGNVLEKFETIDNEVKTVSSQEANIRNAMEEQGVGSKQILESIGQLNEISQQVRGGSEEMLEGSQEVIHESKNLEMVSQEIAGGMNEMAAGAEQINVAVHRVNEISAKNRENINVLVKEVARFKVA